MNLKELFITAKTAYINWINQHIPNPIAQTLLAYVPLIGVLSAVYTYLYPLKELTILLNIVLSTICIELLEQLRQKEEAYKVSQNQLTESQKEPKFIPFSGVLWKKYNDTYHPCCSECQKLMHVTRQNHLDQLVCPSERHARIVLRDPNGRNITCPEAKDFLLKNENP